MLPHSLVEVTHLRQEHCTSDALFPASHIRGTGVCLITSDATLDQLDRVVSALVVFPL